MKNIFLFITSFFFCVFMGNAQETTIQHTVEKGDTVFQLSIKYNVSPEDIYALNPSAVDVIKIGEVLSIPRNGSRNTSTTSTTLNTTASNQITYAVVYGDTKYSLARRFGITIEEFERQNPHTRNGLQAGHILKIEGQIDSSTPTNITVLKTHLVLKGQTLWGISKENGLTVEQLVNANSDILNGILQIGQELKIPAPYSVNGSKSNIYLVQRGDTKFGLSKKYNVTIDELEEANPHIVRMLMAGHTIEIPNEDKIVEDESKKETEPENTEVATVVEPTDESTEVDMPIETEIDMNGDEVSEESLGAKLEISNQNLRFENYEVQPKETLYGLSKKAGMSISDFVTLNPQLENGVQIGTIVKMPINNLSDSEPTTTEEPQRSIKSNSRYVDLSRSIKTIKENQFLLFLPFSDAQFESDYKRSASFAEVSDEFIREHLEFYRGAKIAQDSVRRLGLDFNMKIVETNTSKRNSKAPLLANEHVIEYYDAVLLPFYENDIEEVASLVKDKNTPVLTAGNLNTEQSLKNIYISVPSLNTKRDIMLDYLDSKGGNLIVVCDVARKESRTYISNHNPNAKFIEVSKKGTFNSDEFISLLDPNRMNYVILESEKNSVFLSTTNLLLGQLSQYTIQLALLDKTLIPNTDDVSNKRFVILQMMYPSLTPIKTPSLTSNFLKAYKKSYGIDPTYNTKLGFDLTFDMLLRASQEKNFEASAQNDITEYTMLKFDYKLNKSGNHVNNGVYIIQYNSDGTLKEIK